MSNLLLHGLHAQLSAPRWPTKASHMAAYINAIYCNGVHLGCEGLHLSVHIQNQLRKLGRIQNQRTSKLKRRSASNCVSRIRPESTTKRMSYVVEIKQ